MPAPEELLRAVPFFRDLDRVAIARLAGALEEVRVRKGQVLFREGDPADGLYLVERGDLIITIRSEDDVEVGAFGPGESFGELGLLLARRTATARAASDASLWRLPRSSFEALVRDQTDVALAVAGAVADRLEQRQRGLIGAPQPETEARPLTVERRAERRGLRRRVVGLSLAFLVPLALWPLAPPGGLDERGWHVVVVLLGAAIAWLFEPVPDFVVAIALAAGWGITGAAPLPSVFGGFATSTWVLALGALALAAAMAHSGLLYRAGLFLLRAFPATHTGQVVGLVAGGLVLTPFVPQSVARVAAIGPVTAELR
ncbi:MAG: cyclic nucleotide-binding domain-containing protein, partial [Candidatus Limnocylindria bacterium]